MMVAAPSIHDHAAIGDGRSVALVASDGTIDWLCWPEFDSPAILAALLDTERGGQWRYGPAAGRAPTTRHYRGDSNVLETHYATSDGAVTVVDAMTVDGGARGRMRNNHEIIRRATCTRGSVEMELSLSLRPDFGRKRPRLRAAGDRCVRCQVGAQLYALYSERPVSIEGDLVRAKFVLRAGESCTLSLVFDDEVAIVPLLGEHAVERVDATSQWWHRWVSQLTYQGPHRDAVARSLLAIKLLAFAPSGAVIAAATTSLPERVGSGHNWDYRYCWLRDASFTAQAFYDFGFPEDAIAFSTWVLHATRLTRPELRILYDVYGRLPANEQELPELSGYRGSRPVRIRNAASVQLQLDCYGEVIDAATLLHANDGLDRETQGLVEDLGKFVLACWHHPDHGIWEQRGMPRHRTHSRLMCWVAVDRLFHLRRKGLLRRLDLDHLGDVRAAIREDIERNAWSEARQCYVESFASSELDCSALLLSTYGFESATTARMRSTYERVQESLRAGPGLYWRNDRGKRIGEGAFGICSAWAIDYLARAGRGEEAHAELEAFLACSNEVGLFGEEIDVVTTEALGNFPQAYTHVAVLTALRALIQHGAIPLRGAA
jgi:GH15 family glucan-1,4-alpha-glucosidase